MSFQKPDSTQGPGPRPGAHYSQMQPDSFLLKMLDPSSGCRLDDPEIRGELYRIFELFQRIETLAARELARTEDETATTTDSENSPGDDPEYQQHPEDELDIGGHIVAFDPAEFSSPPQAAPVFPQQERELNTDEASDVQMPSEPVAEATGDGEQANLIRWWVNFNGDVSLERLARLRKVVSESPFTIDAHFDEITDGLIVLSVVTERHLSMDQVEWIIRQVMVSVGLDRESAILSRN